MSHIQEHRKLCNPNRPTSRCRKSKKNKITGRSNLLGSYSFLKQNFGEITDLDSLSLESVNLIESSFYRSLINLSQLYQFEPLISQVKKYPYNICESFDHARQILAKKASHLELLIVQDLVINPCLATAKQCDTGNTLTYVTIETIFLLPRRTYITTL